MSHDHLPKLAIVGRPNVGKSALFNRICKKRIAIVDEAEGVTRDRLYAETELFGRNFLVIDTGGIDAHSRAPFNEQIKRQAEIAIEEADTLIMVVDYQTGPTDLDHEVARILLRTKKPLCLAVNKIDNPSEENSTYNFMSLGISNIVAVSATQSWHIAELLEQALNPVQEKPLPSETEPAGIRLAIVGRPNVGKSSLVNYLLDEERCVVSPIPGTTRDSIDIPFTYGEDSFLLIDTAGIRRKHAEHDVVEKFAAIRTERAIERADVCLLMLDAREGMTTQEKRIASQIEAAGKGCIIVLNKWDLVQGFRMEHCFQGLEAEIPFLSYCPKIFLSAVTGRNIEKIFPEVRAVYDNARKRVSTGQLNKFLEKTMQKTHPPMIGGKRLRVYYMAQVDIDPPRFVLFVNYPNLMTDAYKKYIYNQFREEYDYTGVPLFHLKKRKQDRAEKSFRHGNEFTHEREEDMDDDDDYSDMEEDMDDDDAFEIEAKE